MSKKSLPAKTPNITTYTKYSYLAGSDADSEADDHDQVTADNDSIRSMGVGGSWYLNNWAMMVCMICLIMTV